MKKKLVTLLRFGTVGVGNTLIDFGVFFLLTALNVPYLLAQVCSYTAGILNSYIWNRTWTFRVKEKVRGQEIIRFHQPGSFRNHLSAAVRPSKSGPVPRFQQSDRNGRRNGDQFYREPPLGVSGAGNRFIRIQMYRSE